MSQRATEGRILHVYSPLWTGPQPGIVVGGPWGDGADGEPDQQRANINVFLDGHNNQAGLSFFRNRPEGNTLGSVPVYQQSPKNTSDETWATFPPRVGEAAAPKQLAFECPFKPGDFVVVKLGDVLGQVEDVTFRIGQRASLHVLTCGTDGNLAGRWYHPDQLVPCPESRNPSEWGKA